MLYKLYSEYRRGKVSWLDVRISGMLILMVWLLRSMLMIIYSVWSRFGLHMSIDHAMIVGKFYFGIFDIFLTYFYRSHIKYGFVYFYMLKSMEGGHQK